MSRPGSFWERRKARVEAEEAEIARARQEAEIAERAEALAERSDAEILAEFDLPDPDDLQPGDGIAGFMRREIPDRLRRRAMRKLWRSNPVLACVDGLNDYDGDYTNAATDMPGVKTAYMVGKGMKAHVEALAEAERAKDAQAATPALPETAEPETAMMASDDAEDVLGAPVSQSEVDAADAAPAVADQDRVADATSTTKVADVSGAQMGAQLYTAEDSAPRPRRMRFRFEET